MRACYKCGAEIAARERVPFKELCPKCEAFLHCCRNCRLYDPHAHNHCMSRTTEFVADVERGNFCDEFEFREIEPPRSAAREAAQNGAREAPPAAPAARESRNISAREKFENLFKK